MTPPNHTITPISASDIPTLGGFVAASKIQLAINRFLVVDWPNEAAQLAQSTSAVEGGFQDPMTTTFKVMKDGGEAVGHLALTRRRGQGKKDEKKDNADATEDGKQEVPAGLNPEVLSAVMKMVGEIDQEWDGIEHIQITHIYIAPTSRKLGLGSQLIQLAITKAQAAGLPLAVASEPAAHGFFLKQGFKDTKHVDVDLSVWAEPHCGWGIFRLSGMKLDF